VNLQSRAIGDLLSELDIHPVLIDIGAAGGPPEIWEQIARYSNYVGFDPTHEKTQELEQGRFYKAIVVNKAVTGDKQTDTMQFFLTKSPSCSSTLRPDAKSLSQYLFSDLFTIEREATVFTTSLDSVLQQFSLPRVDWFKTDSQGTDLRLFKSLADPVRSGVLALDIEPGLIDAYQSEDLFIDAHRELTRGGFWLSNLEVRGAVRLRRASWEALNGSIPNNGNNYLESTLKKSPAWCEARYLRTIESLACGEFTRREYVLLWIFALLDDQLGFTVDLTFAYEKAFGSDGISARMRDEIRRRLTKRKHAFLSSTAKHILPSGARRRIAKYLRELLQ
jgi:FkbM family methyltransferase